MPHYTVGEGYACCQEYYLYQMVILQQSPKNDQKQQREAEQLCHVDQGTSHGRIQQMWFKKLIFGSKEQKEPQNENGGESSQLDEESQLPQSRLFTVAQEEVDARYSTLNIIHRKKVHLPSNQLHFVESVLFQEGEGIMARMRHIQQYQPVEVILTDRQMVMTPDISGCSRTKSIRGNNLFYLYFGMLQKVELLEGKKEVPRLKITLKDSRAIIMQSPLIDRLRQIERLLKEFGFPNGINKFYAFKYGKVTPSIEGWGLFDLHRELERQNAMQFCHDPRTSEQVSPHHVYQIVYNSTFEICQTYPQAFVVPVGMSRQDIIKCSKFRTKERLPVFCLLYEYQPNCYCSLFRCSQTKGGILGSRSEQDQKMIRQIDVSTRTISVKEVDCGSQINCKIYDARGYYAALGNKISGKGFETPEAYNCEVEFLNIPNIHAVRQSYNRLKAFNFSRQNFLEALAESGWMDYVSLILSGAKSMACSMLKGTNVIVHCSDGWDRTTQLACLTQIILDPYFRTIEGFGCLVEKEWRECGHKFRERSGQWNHKEYNQSQKSPIFIQFLDCVLQLCRQYPLSFQFNTSLLNFLAEAYQSYTYGTFLTNNAKESKFIHLHKNTVSVWSDVLQHRQQYLNDLYEPKGPKVLQVSVESKDLYLWTQLFLEEYSMDQEQLQVLRRQQKINSDLLSNIAHIDEQIEQLRRELEGNA